MAPKRFTSLAACSLALLLLTSCLPSVVQTDHGYLLLRQQDGELVFLPDDDPLYSTYDDQVLADPYLRSLLALFDHTTAAIIATEEPTSYPHTIANKALIVVDSAQVGVLHKVQGRYQTATVRGELALGLGHDGQVDPEWARQQFPRVLGQLLLEIMEWRPPAAPAGPVALYDTTSPELALQLGFQAALDTLYGQAAPERALTLRSRDDLSAAERDLLARYDDVPRNAFRYRFVDGRPTAELRTPAEAVCTPGVVATFFYRLFQHTSGYYPQREMLWFANYEDDDRTSGQVLLPIRRLEHPEQGMARYVASYCETFPAEAAAISELATQVFGADPRQIAP
jgi:hypothetical protein